MSKATATPATGGNSEGDPKEPASANQEVETPAQDTTDWKKEARKWESLAKQNKDAAERLAALEEAAKSEEAKAAEELERLRSENAEFRAREQIAQWAQAIATETGVPAVALKGSTEDELREHAETIKALIDAEREAAASNGPPKTKTVVSSMGEVPDPEKSASLDDQIAAAQSEGNADMVSLLKAQKLAGIATN